MTLVSHHVPAGQSEGGGISTPLYVDLPAANGSSSQVRARGETMLPPLRIEQPLAANIHFCQGLYHRWCHYTYETKDSTLSELQRFSKFTHAEFGEIRQVWMDGQVWFVLSDVAKVLGYSRTSDAIKHLRDSQYNTANRRVCAELGFLRGRAPILITESGLYRLMLRSDATNAEPFQIWVEDEVLPTVRQAYTVGIDVVEELKGRIRELDSLVKMHEISAEGEEARGRKQFLNGVRAGRNNPDLDYHAIYEGRFVPWEQADEDEDVLL